MSAHDAETVPGEQAWTVCAVVDGIPVDDDDFRIVDEQSDHDSTWDDWYLGPFDRPTRKVRVWPALESEQQLREVAR